MENNENFVTEEVTENVEQTTEETQQEATQQEKTYTQAEVDAIVGKRLARKEARIRKEYDREYGDLMEVLKAGTGASNAGEMAEKFRGFYKENGVQIPEKPTYTEKDNAVLAEAEANEIISGGYDDVVEEVDRLAKIGYERMSAREKVLYKTLAEYRQSEERSRELSGIGVTEDVYNSAEFKNFAKQFNASVPIKDVFDIYRKTQPKKEYKQMGSMKQTPDKGAKDYYSPEEIAALTEEDLADPKVWDAVRRSMTGG